jgi:hypothetical protein
MEVIVSEGWKDVAASQGDVRNQQRPVIALTKSLQEDCPCYCLYAIPGQFPPGVSRPLVHLAGLECSAGSWLAMSTWAKNTSSHSFRELVLFIVAGEVFILHTPLLGE